MITAAIVGAVVAGYLVGFVHATRRAQRAAREIVSMAHRRID